MFVLMLCLGIKRDVLRWLVQGVGSVGFVAGDIDLKRLNAVVDYVVGHKDTLAFCRRCGDELYS